MSLIIEDITTGQGKEAEKGKEITVHYTGWLQDARNLIPASTAASRSPSCWAQAR